MRYTFRVARRRQFSHLEYNTRTVLFFISFSFRLRRSRVVLSELVVEEGMDTQVTVLGHTIED